MNRAYSDEGERDAARFVPTTDVSHGVPGAGFGFLGRSSRQKIKNQRSRLFPLAAVPWCQIVSQPVEQRHQAIQIAGRMGPIARRIYIDPR